VALVVRQAFQPAPRCDADPFRDLLNVFPPLVVPVMDKDDKVAAWKQVMQGNLPANQVSTHVEVARKCWQRLLDWADYCRNSVRDTTLTSVHNYSSARDFARHYLEWFRNAINDDVDKTERFALLLALDNAVEHAGEESVDLITGPTLSFRTEFKPGWPRLREPAQAAGMLAFTALLNKFLVFWEDATLYSRPHGGIKEQPCPQLVAWLGKTTQFGISGPAILEP